MITFPQITAECYEIRADFTPNAKHFFRVAEVTLGLVLVIDSALLHQFTEKVLPD